MSKEDTKPETLPGAQRRDRDRDRDWPDEETRPGEHSARRMPSRTSQLEGLSRDELEERCEQLVRAVQRARVALRAGNPERAGTILRETMEALA